MQTFTHISPDATGAMTQDASGVPIGTGDFLSTFTLPTGETGQAAIITLSGNINRVSAVISSVIDLAAHHMKIQ